MERENIEDIIALTPMQEGMLYHYLKNPSGDLYVEQSALELRGVIDRQILERAWNYVIENNEMLRTSFRWEKMKKPVQTVLKTHRLKIDYHDLTGEGELKQEERLESIKTGERQKGFDLQRVPFRVIICKREERAYTMIISHHHILLDGWSSGIILKEFFHAYHELSRGNELPAPRMKGKFKEFVKWIQTRDSGEQETYWKVYLEGFDTRTAVPLKAGKGKEYGHKGYPCMVTALTAAQVEGAGAFARRHKVTLAALYYTCWGLLLQSYNNCGDVVFGTTVSGRAAKVKSIENIAGLFINTLPLRLTVHAGDTPAGIVQRIDRALQGREPYESTPLVDIEKYSTVDTREGLFDSVWVIENYPLEKRINDESEPGDSNLSVQSYSSVEQTNYDLAVGVTISDETRLDWIYNSSVLEGGHVVRLAGSWSYILQQVLAGPDRLVSAVEIIEEEEKARVLYEFNGGEKRTPYPSDKTLPQLYLAQAVRFPHHTALYFENNHLTFDCLKSQAAALAGSLHCKGVQEGEPVGLLAERSLEMIIGMLGILSAGCGYVPLNPNAPAARNQYLLKESGVRLLFTGPGLEEQGLRIGEWPCEVIGRKNPAQPFPGPRTAASLAYIIFTSGSTGKPKGVPIRHSNLSPLLHWGYEHLGLSISDRSLQNLSYYFDWSVWEIFITLTSGAALYIAADKILLDPAACIAFIRTKGITVLHITPTQFQTLANAAIGSNQKLPSLKHLCIGAEKLTHDLVRRSYAVVNDDCRIYNMYGPTEATIMSAVLEIQRDRDEVYRQLSSVPIGIPIANLYLLILDRNYNLSPIGITGNLYIARDGLTQGYLNNPSLTAERFIEIDKSFSGGPGGRLFKKAPLAAGGHLYTTGDLSRWLEDGSVEFLGRIDHQVKIRGFRIEPGEIEKRLLEHPAVKDAAVTIGERKDGDRYLSAYVVLEDTANVKELKEFLSRTLPAYMIPGHIVKIAEMPLTANKKIDTAALAQLDGGGRSAGAAYVPPRSALEEKLVVIWQKVLSVEKIGINDDFFDIGGHSLKVLDLVNAVQREFSVKIELQDVFEFPTIERLQHCIEKGLPASYTSIPLQPEQDYYELSYSQKRLWLLCKQDPDSPGFNLSGSIVLYEPVEENVIRGVLEALVERHESFRTYFKKIDGKPVQIILPRMEVELQTADISDLDLEQREASRQRIMERERSRPFRLETPPLSRALLLKSGPAEFHLVLTMHHLITDGRSVEILEREFHILYQSYKKGETRHLQSPALRYRDYVYWHNRLIADPAGMEGAKGFWEKHLHGDLPRLNLPYDYPGSDAVSKAGGGYRTVLPAELTGRLREMAKSCKASLFMVLLAGFNLLLSKICGQEDILLGIPAAARQHNDLKDIVGLFVNTLVLKNRITRGQSFGALLERVQDNTMRALEYQSYPLELICSRFKIKYPEISVFFNMLTFGDSAGEYLQDHKSYGIEKVQEVKFHLVCYLTEYKNGVEIETHYSRELFMPGTVAKIMGKYVKLLGVTAVPAGGQTFEKV